MKNKILHISGCDKFIPPFIDFIKNNFKFSDHYFVLANGMAEKNLKKYSNVYLSKKNIMSKIYRYLLTVIKMHQSKKIILHSLFDFRIVVILFFMPWLLKKSYWIMWGGDLYFYQSEERNWNWKVKEFFRRKVIKNMGYLVTYIKGDFELAKKWYDARGQYHECLMYTTNLYKEYDIPKRRSESVNILVGNSAVPGNNHLEIFDRIETLKDQDIKIYVPLSYGDKVYAQRIIKEGRKRFGEKFIAITDFMSFSKYLEFLSLVDVAIFNHKRQQAMGNTITLLGLGKKVYMRTDVTQWRFFQAHKILVFDIKDFNVNPMEIAEINDNVNYIKKYFSSKNYKSQLEKLFL